MTNNSSFQNYTWQLQANDTVLAIQADSYLSKLSNWPLKNSLMTILNSISKTSLFLFQFLKYSSYKSYKTSAVVDMIFNTTMWPVLFKPFEKLKLCGCNYIYRTLKRWPGICTNQNFLLHWTNLNISNLQRVAQTNKIVEIVSTGRIAVTVIEGADTMLICKTTATPPVLTATVSKIHDIQQWIFKIMQFLAYRDNLVLSTGSHLHWGSNKS